MNPDHPSHEQVASGRARYTTQFRNGTWQVFDRDRWAVVGATDTQFEAEALLAELAWTEAVRKSRKSFRRGPKH